jgi:predicted MFS family arabinose efflux permease
MAVLVAALGYFVDIYDLILFGVVRTPSLVDLGVADTKAVGLSLFRWQMGGMLVGGVLWGVIADKRGRLSVLFASIVTYSVANVVNGLVEDVTQYKIVRFVAGVGLAGELGAGITLVSELMRRETRGWGTTIVATIGICGGVVGGLVGDEVHWRTAYFIGGGLGFALLILRIGVRESGMFKGLDERRDVRRGDLLQLLGDGRRALRYLAVIAVGVPIWFAVGILIQLSPELGLALGLPAKPNAPDAFMWCYAGLAIGDLASGALSQLLRSRKKALLAFILLTAAMIGLYFAIGGRSETSFYVACFGLGVATGYWAVFVTSAAEQFGTNLRGTVATTAPNVVRGAVVPVTFGYQTLEPSLGMLGAAAAVGAITIFLALVALAALSETYGKDLDYVEE